MIELLGMAGIISLLRDANTVHDSYKKVSGIVHGTDHEQLISCTQQMQQEQAFNKNSWEVLMDTRPTAYASRPNNNADILR